jgi:hypothetical protein
MKKNLVKLLVIFFIFLNISYTQETKGIPAFYFDIEGSQALFINDMIAKGFYPINHDSYQQGIINVPNNMIPFILFTKDDNKKFFELVSLKDNNLNHPSYLWEYDPFEKLKTIPVSKLNLAIWQKQNSKNDLFLSDGSYKTISCMQDNKHKLFLYAPTDNMSIKINSGIPFFHKTHDFFSKKERQGLKIFPQKGYHITSRAITNRKEAHYHRNVARRKGLDTVVIDFKSFLSSIQKDYSKFSSFVNEPNTYLLTQLTDLAKIVEILKLSKVKISFRINIAVDRFIEEKNPELMLWDKKRLQPWQDNYGQQWVDLFSKEALEYYKKIIELAILLGADNIQLDYLRFPSEGEIGNISTRHNLKKQHRYKAIEDYLKEISYITDANSKSFSVNILGKSLWNDIRDIENSGQNILIIMRYADIISPIIYPSHFPSKFLGIQNPSNEPYLIVSKACEQINNIIKLYPYYHVIPIPWIQAFNYLSPNFGEEYIINQIKAVLDNNLQGVLAWNSRNEYEVFFKAIQQGILE